MKYLILILITFSLKTFAHEVENHPEHLTNTCSVSDVGRYQASEEELLHYLNQDCNFSIKDAVLLSKHKNSNGVSCDILGFAYPCFKKTYRT